MYNSDISKLIIKNIALLEEAPKIIEEIEKKLYEAINAKFKKFLEDHDDWKGEYSYGEESGEATLAPDSWPEDENGSYWAWYTLGPSKTSNEDYQYDLTALFGQTPHGRFALSFGVYREGLCGMNKKAWKDYLLKEYKERPELKLNGVQLEREVLLIPINLDAAKVEAEYPDDLDECLKPIDDALSTLTMVHPQIDQIVNKASEQMKEKI